MLHATCWQFRSCVWQAGQGSWVDVCQAAWVGVASQRTTWSCKAVEKHLHCTTEKHHQAQHLDHLETLHCSNWAEKWAAVALAWLVRNWLVSSWQWARSARFLNEPSQPLELLGRVPLHAHVSC